MCTSRGTGANQASKRGRMATPTEGFIRGAQRRRNRKEATLFRGRGRKGPGPGRHCSAAEEGKGRADGRPADDSDGCRRSSLSFAEERASSLFRRRRRGRNVPAPKPFSATNPAVGPALSLLGRGAASARAAWLAPFPLRRSVVTERHTEAPESQLPRRKEEARQRETRATTRPCCSGPPPPPCPRLFHVPAPAPAATAGPPGPLAGCTRATTPPYCTPSAYSASCQEGWPFHSHAKRRAGLKGQGSE